MRTVKFRAWSVEFQHMIDHEGLILENGEWTGIADTYISNIGIQNLDLMQYTGLKDKNEVEIYSGDLLAFDAREWYRPDHEGKEDYVFEVKQDESGEWMGAGNCMEWNVFCKVVGNIHQNPSLIERN